MSTEQINGLLAKFDEKPGAIDLSLERIVRFLALIGNPEKRIPPVIHFAGTNGKGSTLAFLKAMIEASGKTCHAYISPHLVKFNERISINGQDIEDDFLLEVLREVDAAWQKHKHEITLTFFELTTIAAFIAFSRVPADYVLLETGMGGRFDATNLIEKPLLTIITPISLDHMEFLGDTVGEIALNKAGIMKPGVTCISAPQEGAARQVLLRTAAELKCKLVFAQMEKNLPELALKGAHQKMNASVAVAAAREIKLPEAAVLPGLNTAIWPARLQKLTRGSLPDLLPHGFNLWLDGAHNLAGAKVLAAEISQPAYLIIGMMATKDATAYLNELKGKLNAVYTIPIRGEKCFAPEDLAKIAVAAGFEAYAARSAEAAVKAITTNERGNIYITGSLYLAGKILEDNN